MSDGLSLPEQVAREMCWERDCHTLNKRCWKQQLLWLDTKTTEQDRIERLRLYDIAFIMRPPHEFVTSNHQKRHDAETTIKAKWGSIQKALVDERKERGNPRPEPSCFTGECLVLMGDHQTHKPVEEIRAGDLVATTTTTAESARRVVLVEKTAVFGMRKMVQIKGALLTCGHPVQINGEWTHPFEVGKVKEEVVSYLYNFELEGGPEVDDHSVVIGDVVCSTLGKNCGRRMIEGWPNANNRWGTGYWQSGVSFFETHNQ